MAGNDGTLNFDTKIDSSGFEKGLDKIGGVAGKGMAATGKVLGGAAAALTALGGAAIKVGSDFEAGMSQVQAVSGASGEELEKLKEKAQEMGEKTKFSATESAEAMNYMAMAGWKTEDMLGGIEGIMNLAAASGEDLATTSDIVTDAMTAFGMSASGTTKIMEDGLTKEVANATHFADILAAASSNANTNVGMMGDTFKYVAPLAGALGYSAEDTAVAVGLMAKAGIKGSQAGTALRAMLTRLAKPTKESADAMATLGLSITDSSGEMKPLKEIIGDMRGAFSGLTEDEQASYAAMLGGQEAMSGLLAIVNASDKDFEKLSGAINDCNGSAAEMAEIMQDNLQGQLVILQSGLEGLGVSMYETMQGTAKDVVKEARGMVRQLRDAFNTGGFQGLVSAFGLVLAQIIGQIAGAAPMVVEAAVQLVGSFCAGIKYAPGIGESGAGLITSLVTGLMSCVGQIWTTAIVLAGRLAQGIAAGAPQMVEAVSGAVLSILECITGWLPGILQAGGTIIMALIDGAAGAFPALMGHVLTIISILYDGLMAALPQITAAGVDIMNGLAQGITDNLPSMIPAAMEALVQFSGSLRENVGLLVDAGLNLIMALAQSLIDNIPVFIKTIPTIITNIAGIINDNAPKLLACGIELIARLAAGLIQAIPTLVSNIPQIIQAVVSVFTAFNWISLGQNVISFIANGIKSLATSIPTALRNIGQTAKDWLRTINWRTLGSDIIDLIVIGVRSLMTAVPNMLKSIGQTAVEWFKGIDWLDLGINVVQGIISGITGALDGLWSAVGDLCSGMLDGVKGFFGINSPSTVMAEQGDYLVQGLINGVADMPAQLAQYLDQTVQKITDWGQQMLNRVQSSIQNVVKAAVSLIAQLPGKIWTWLVNVITKVTQWGQQMLNTAKSVMQRMISAVISLLSELPGKVWTWLVNVVTKVTAWGQQMLNTAQNAISTMISAVINLLSQLPGKVWTWLVNTVTKVTQWGQQMISGAKSAISNMVSSVVSLISELPGKMWSWLTNALSRVTDWGRQMVSGARSAIGDMLSSVSSHMAELPGRVAEKLSDAAGRVASWAGDMASRGADAARSLYSAVVDGISGLPGEMASIGSNIINGIWGGISSGWNWLSNQVSNVAHSLLDSAKNALGINSPSKAFRDEFGQWLMPGTVEGLKASMPKALREMEVQAGALLAAMQGTVDASMHEVALNASGAASVRMMSSGGTTVYNDNHMEQENNYHVPVATPSETNKAQREAFRKFAGGVK